jgi:acetolactate synthase-1/2/3 large subunit
MGTDTHGPTYGDDLVDSFADAGVGAVFFTSGSDIIFYQEALARRRHDGLDEPRLVTVPHELVNINAALGYTAVCGRPSVTAAHVDVGTLNYGAGLHNVSRAGLPIVVTAGMPATADPGSMAGARDGGHFFTQQVPDQNGIARQYVKWDHQLQYQDNPWNVAGRAVQVATAPPCGPVYLSIPREVSMLPTRDDHTGRVPFAARGQVTVGVPPRDVLVDIAARLVAAEDPVVVVGSGGREPGAMAALTALVEELGLWVVDGCTAPYQCLPMGHPHYWSGRDVKDADVVLVLDCDVPWLAGQADPRETATVVVVGSRPATEQLRLLDLRATHRVMSTSAAFCTALLDVLREETVDADRLRARVERVRRDVAEARATEHRRVLDRRSEDHIDPDWAAMAVAEALPADALVLDDTVYSAPVRRYLSLPGPAQYFRNPSTAGGWGPGAALGASLAQRERPVVLVTGDGFYMYGVPTVALWAARAHRAPFLAVVFQNDSYNTGTEEAARFYPGGFAQEGGFKGGYFDHPVDFVAEATGTGAYGENVTASAELQPAITRGLERVADGQAAVIAVHLPRLLELPPG